MGRTEIPKRIIITCDVCKVECDRANRRRSGQIIVRQDALDFRNDPVADGSVERDLCDACLDKVCRAINAALEKGDG